MRDLMMAEVELVSGGGLADGGFALAIPAAIGLVVSVSTIVLGAITGSFTFGLGYVAMAAGIVGTAISGVAMVASVVIPILSSIFS